MTADQYKERRKALGLTQEELAKKLGVSRKTVVLRESGKTITREAELSILSLAPEKGKSVCYNRAVMKKKILNHPQVESLEEWKDESGRREGWAAHLVDGWNWEGCSFVRGNTLREVAAELKGIDEGDPY